MSLINYLFPSDAHRPHPDQAAPDDLAVGDIVEIEFADWYEGAHTLEGKVLALFDHDRVKVGVQAGSEYRKYSVERGVLRLVRRAGA